MPTFVETWGGTPNGVPTSSNSSIASLNVAAGDAIRVSDFLPSHGPRGVVMEWSSAGAGATRLLWSQAEAGRYVLSTYVYVTDPISVFEDIMGIRHAAGGMASLAVGDDGKLVVTNAAGAGLGVSRAPAAMPSDAWVRIDLAVRKGTTTTDGYIGYAYYLGDSATPVYSWESSEMNAGTADVAAPFIGRGTGRAGARTIYYGTTRGASLASGFMAPYSAPKVAPALRASNLPEPAEPGQVVSIPVTSGDTRPLTYSLTQVFGPSVPLAREANTWAYRAPAVVGGASLRFRAVGTTADGVTGSLELEHQVRAASEFAVRGGKLVPGFFHVGSLTADEGVPTVPDPTPVTPPPATVPATGNPLPNISTVKYESLYRAGDTLPDVVARMTSPAVLLLPAGVFEIVDFKQGNYGISSDNLRGIGGLGPSQTKIRLRKNSSTRASAVPTQLAGGTNPINMMRIGSSAGGQATTLFGLTIEGTAQGHLYNGVSNYKSKGSIWQDLVFRGCAPGDYSSPPGETFVINSFRGEGNIYRNIEVDGRDPDTGQRVGGSPFGGNAALSDTLEGCYFHDAWVSSETHSFAGSPTNPDAPSRNVTTRNLRIENNANHTMASGLRFTGVNHENVMGAIRHYSPSIVLDPVANSEWLTAHMVFVNVLADNPDIEIHEPTWKNGSPLNGGCFTVKSGKTFLDIANKQVSSPKVVKNGRLLEPYVLRAYSSSGVPSHVKPDTHYVHIQA